MVSHTRSDQQLTPRGFALADIIVAMVLLAITLATAVTITGRAMTSQSQGERLATAAMLADQQLQLILARGPDDYARRFAVSGACDAPFAEFRFELKFTGGASVGQPYNVVCTISWADGAAQRAIAVETLVAPRTGSQDDQPDPIRTPQTQIIRTPL